MAKDTTWQKRIEHLSVADLLRVFPALGQNTAYAWKAGTRRPPEYAQPALASWLLKQAAKVPAPNGPPIKRASPKAPTRKRAAA